MKKLIFKKKILVVVAHPDDEILGLGGTINKAINEYNCEVKCLILGEGLTSRSPKRDKNIWSKNIVKHKKNIKEAAKKIGYCSIATYDLPDNRFDSVDLIDIVKIVEFEKEKFKPEIIFTHHSFDLNIDHRITFDAVMTACRPLQGETVKSIVTFETPSSTEWQEYTQSKVFCPNLFIEIKKDNLQAKINAMESYQFEKRKYPHPRSPESLEILAKRWGIVIGKEYAEAFKIVRSIII